MFRVLHIVGDSMSRAGMETFIMNIYRSIDISKYQFDFLVHSDKKGDFDEEINIAGGSIYRVKPDLEKAFLVRVFKRFYDTYKFLKKSKSYNVIHIHTSSATSLIELLAAFFSGCNIRIVHSHNTDTQKSKLHKSLYRFMKYFSTHRFACSELAGEWMFGKNFKNLKNSKVIKNGIDSNIFSFDIEKQRKIKYDFNLEDKLVIGHIGRFSKVKNHDFIIDIFYQVYKNNKNAILLLIGDGELRSEIENKVNKLGLAANVKFEGVRTNIDEYLLSMDIMLFPSFHEGLPVTFVEAQATGLKIITSDSVSREADITGLIKYVSLDKTSAEWSDILNEEVGYVRKDQTHSIKKRGFDIDDIANELCKVYGQ